MNSVQIYRIKLKNPILSKDFNITDYITDDHKQDCCERVYIDFEHVDMNKQSIEDLGRITEIELMSAPEEGVIINLYNGERDCWDKKRVSIFLACRNEQNGYYNDDLDIILKIEGLEIRTSLREYNCIQDETY